MNNLLRNYTQTALGRPNARRTDASRCCTGLTSAARKITCRPSEVLVGMRTILVMGSASKSEARP